MRTAALLLALAALPTALTRQIPDALQSFYDTVKDGHCPTTLHSGLRRNADSRATFRYCTDDSSNLMWIAGPSSLADMDVDCDGANNAHGACENDPTGQSITAFQDEVSQFGIADLDANLHSYVVLGTGGFDPRKEGVSSLSVVAVFYGVWGDSNADDLVGEASLSLATACYGNRMNGNYGHAETDVLYLAFRTDEAVPGRNASW
ncbi:fungal chitosanase [Morchella conica CCBAS932]|uniref:Endo-chitosanase n=1 Tax=Morchella conica CCBAS932 TaxID=1392247 RepID=A0A3N4KY92_9PEZI|nr:fungal chitosanase [Morchella conica CCBAS932]